MNDFSQSMVLIYDLKHDEQRRLKLLANVNDQWEAYLKGQRLVNISFGYISELFYAPYEGEPMFKLNEGCHTTSWVRQGDNSWYAVGRQVRIEHVIFELPPPIGNTSVVVKIWIGSVEGSVLEL